MEQFKFSFLDASLSVQGIRTLKPSSQYSSDAVQGIKGYITSLKVHNI